MVFILGYLEVTYTLLSDYCSVVNWAIRTEHLPTGWHSVFSFIHCPPHSVTPPGYSGPLGRYLLTGASVFFPGVSHLPCASGTNPTCWRRWSLSALPQAPTRRWFSDTSRTRSNDEMMEAGSPTYQHQKPPHRVDDIVHRKSKIAWLIALGLI